MSVSFILAGKLYVGSNFSWYMGGALTYIVQN